MDYIEPFQQEFPDIKPLSEMGDEQHHEKADKLLYKGKLVEAEIEYKKLILKIPYHYFGHEGIAYTYYFMGARKKACWFMKKAIEIIDEIKRTGHKLTPSGPKSIEVCEEIENGIKYNYQQMLDNKELVKWWDGDVFPYELE